MGCWVVTTASGRLALRLQWVLDGRSIGSHDALGVPATKRNAEAAQRDFADAISGEMRARKFDRRRYLEWFPGGAKAGEFRPVGLVVASVARQVDTLSLRDWYTRWIETKRPPFVRKSRIRDYRQHMQAYILPALGNEALVELTVERLEAFEYSLVAREKRPLSVKTARNVIVGTLKACLRDAMLDGHVQFNAAAKLIWDDLPVYEPDPFTATERDKILQYFATAARGHYFPINATLFTTGMRQSEATALRVADVELSPGSINIRLSRHLGEENAPKTERSRRRTPIPAELVEVLRPLVEGRPADAYLFTHLKSGPIDQGQWPKDYRKTALRKLKIRHRKWYATRHTFISLSLTEGANITALARYCGTSVAMIDSNYARWNPGNDRAILDNLSLPGVLRTQRSKALVAFRPKKRSGSKASPTGFEPVSPA